MRAVFAMESRETALAKAEQVAAEMEGGRLKAAADCLRGGGRRDDHVPAAGVPGRAPQEDTHQQHVLWAGFAGLAVLLGFGVV